VDRRSGSYDADVTAEAVIRTVLEVVGLVAALLLVRRFGPHALHAWSIYAGAPTRRMTDAGPEPVPPPPAVGAVLDKLAAEGLTRLGERAVVLPDGRMVCEWLAG
jgi:hypothetical protein